MPPTRAWATNECYSSALIERLAADLAVRFPGQRGWSARNLHYMRAFALAWPADQIGSWTRIFDVLDSTSLQGAFERLDRVDVKSIVLGPEPGELHPVRRRSPTSPYGRRNSR